VSAVVKATGAMVVLRGGSRDGWVYYAVDFDVQVAACKSSGMALGYEATDEFEPWAYDLAINCRVWRATNR